MALELSSSSLIALIIINTSVKNSIAAFIIYMHIHNKPIIKMLHYAINVISTKAELFAIRYSINQAIHLNDILRIIIVTNSIHVARKIFSSSSYFFQKYAATILNKLREFFSHHQKNFIEFWEYFSQCKWNPYKIINAETKLFNLTLLYFNKYSWDLVRKMSMMTLSTDGK